MPGSFFVSGEKIRNNKIIVNLQKGTLYNRTENARDMHRLC